jgi:hypothetical protein
MSVETDRRGVAAGRGGGPAGQRCDQQQDRQGDDDAAPSGDRGETASTASRPRFQMRASAGELSELGLESVEEVVAHPVANPALSRASPRLTRLRTTICEQPSERAISPY